MNFSNKSAFTLVELVVVIAILAILGTVGFLSLQGYSSSARDSARLSDLANLSKAMDAQLAAGKLLPQPNAPMVTLTASGTTVGYQGCAGSGVLGILGLSGKTQDPLNGTCYTYETNAAQNRYQVLSLQENASQATAMGIPLVDTAYAGPYDTRVPATRGNQLGILLWTGANLNQPAQEYASSTGIDLAKTTTGSGYVMVFSNSDTTASVPTSGSGAYTGALFTFAYNHRPDLLTDKSLAAMDPNLVGYWDMETLTGAKLRDWSKYGNDATCYDWGSQVNCWTGWTWPQFYSLKSGQKGMLFDGFDDVIRIADTGTSSLQVQNDLTILAKIRNTAYNSQSGTYIATKYTNYLLGTWSYPGCSGNTAVGNLYYPASIWFNLSACYDYWSDMTTGFTRSQGLIKSYTNASLTSTTTESWSVLYTNTQDFAIGWAPTNSTRGFKGIIDEVRVYSRALSDSEIQVFHNATK